MATRRSPPGKPNRITAAARREIVNGGIVASLIDCHSLNFAIAHAYRAEGRAHRQLAADRLRHGKFEYILFKADAYR